MRVEDESSFNKNDRFYEFEHEYDRIVLIIRYTNHFWILQVKMLDREKYSSYEVITKLL